MSGERYWEIYDDQSSADFSTLSYESLSGDTIEVQQKKTQMHRLEKLDA